MGVYQHAYDLVTIHEEECRRFGPGIIDRRKNRSKKSLATRNPCFMESNDFAKLRQAKFTSFYPSIKRVTRSKVEQAGSVGKEAVFVW